MTIEQLLKTLSRGTPAALAAAHDYAKQADKFIWVQTTLLDPNNISRRHTNAVEDALASLL
jgi:hypothetical protein